MARGIFSTDIGGAGCSNYGQIALDLLALTVASAVKMQWFTTAVYKGGKENWAVAFNKV